MTGPTKGLDAKVAGFFMMRDSWAWTDPKGWFGDGKNKWPWLDHTPQQYGWTESPQKPEEVSVAVAEHPTTPIGRSFHGGTQPPREQARPEQGLYFAEQWKRALQVDPTFVFVTGWNAWIAQRFLVKDKGTPRRVGYETLRPGDTFFVDAYSQEFSRDIEPMRGGHGDAYYYQLADNVRRYKGVRPLPSAGAARTVRIDGDFGQWRGVTSEYLDDGGDTAPRDSQGFGDAGRLTNDTGRNDIDAAHVKYDDTNVYFHVRTAGPLTPPAKTGWMTLLVRTKGAGWDGYDFVINRTAPQDGKTAIERVGDGRKWPSVGQAAVHYAGNDLHLSVPRRPLGGGPLRFEFKWLDNAPVGDDPVNVIDTGDVAPNGRFDHRFDAGK